MKSIRDRSTMLGPSSMLDSSMPLRRLPALALDRWQLVAGGRRQHNAIGIRHRWRLFVADIVTTPMDAVLGAGTRGVGPNWHQPPRIPTTSARTRRSARLSSAKAVARSRSPRRHATWPRFASARATSATFSAARACSRLSANAAAAGAVCRAARRGLRWRRRRGGWGADAERGGDLLGVGVVGRFEHGEVPAGRRGGDVPQPGLGPAAAWQWPY